MTLPDVTAAATFEEFVQLRSQALLRAAFLLTGDAGHAEDLLQDSLARLALRWAKVAAAGDPEPWVRTVMLRTWLSWRRRLWWRERPVSVLPERESPEAVAVAERDLLHRALLQLPPRQRACVVLRAYVDLSEAQAAEHLGCSVGTVKSSYARGLARLRDLLSEGNPA